MRKLRTHVRLAAINGIRVDPGSRGYRSGRSRWRDTPDMDSIDSTRSAGTRPAAIQPDTVPWERSPKARASADCPPTASQASKSASFIRPINAQTGNAVNAYSGSCAPHNKRMAKSKLPASSFWLRLEEAVGHKYAPFNPNHLASRLTMSQGTTHRWYTGTGFPEMALAKRFAEEGGVCVDWLLNGTRPKHPISKDPVLRELFEICDQLEPAHRRAILHAAQGEMALQEKESLRRGSKSA